MSGSAATRLISKPSGSLNFFCSSSGLSQGVLRTPRAKGSSWADADERRQGTGDRRQETITSGRRLKRIGREIQAGKSERPKNGDNVATAMIFHRRQDW